ncbi:hypothetical protein MMC30_005690 [Trapelia coarctata]|nr:hypothetical protein [Trapelia coarctata]
MNQHVQRPSREALESREAMKAQLVGRQLGQLPTPAAVLDRAVIKRNCTQMLQACDKLNVLFRPHIKTHKTVEVTQLQVGHSNRNVNIIVSTLAEAEHVADYLKDCRSSGKSVNILYGVPLPPSQAPRLGALGKELGPGSISVMIDHVGQLKALRTFKDVAGFEAGIFIKVDSGYGRAGLQPHSYALHELLKTILSSNDSESCGYLHGLYSHAGHSYGVNNPAAAMDHLSDELDGLRKAAVLAEALMVEADGSNEPKPRFVLSVGATPSATSVQNLIQGDLASEGVQAASIRLRECIKQANLSHHVELHAGVYTCLDMQQVATHASPSSDDPSKRISYTDLALTILVEVASVYDDRKPSEALVAAGSLALGREPCKSYKGWGVVSNWGMTSRAETGCSDWEVARISQEHGILQKLTTATSLGLDIGQKVKIWPNHACIAGAGFGSYVVVDSDLPVDRRDEVVDVWKDSMLPSMLYDDIDLHRQDVT